MSKAIPSSLRFLLLQVRDPDDAMRDHERMAFSRVLDIDPQRCDTADLLSDGPTQTQLDRADVVLLGGSGNYSAVDDAPWLDRSLDLLRGLVERRQPTFASCWGFQAMARALGGTVVHDPGTAEVGTHRLYVTSAGREDPVFSGLGQTFLAQMGHEDCVQVLPPSATLLAFSELNTHQAYRVDGAPVYCTQFHPELTRDDLHARVATYPQYVERITGQPISEFIAGLEETPRAASLIRRFVEVALGDSL
tara:strand:- start:763 stop:1509 length:747 start_codon:yes stop_codon:yes gene_type:complete